MLHNKPGRAGTSKPHTPPPVVKADPSGALAGVGDVTGDDFTRALEASTPAEYRDDKKPDGDKPVDDAQGKTDAPATDKPAADAKPVDAKGAVDKPVDDKTKPAAKTDAKPDTKPADAKPVDKPAVDAAKPVALDPNEEIALGDDLKYSRGQLATAVKQYPELLAGANEAVEFRKIFGVDAKTAEKGWAPLIQKLNTEKPFSDYVTKFLEAYGNYGTDPEFAEYIFERCLPSWEAHLAEMEGVEPAQRRQQQEPVDVEARNRLAAIERTESERGARETRDYIAREVQTLQAGDPRLADPDVLAMVWEFALVRQQQQPGYTLTQAAHDCEGRIRRMTAQAEQPAAKPAVEVPALVSGGGAAPLGTRAPIDATEELVFPSTDAALADWKKNRAKYREAGLFKE